MKIERIEIKKAASIQGAVIAVGNLDGVHIGHQVLLEVARKRSLAQGRPFGVLTFDPHPRRTFRPEDPPFLITPGTLKFKRLEASLVDIIYIASFTPAFAHLSAHDFIEGVLQKSLDTHDVTVGHDFHFGRDRQGSYRHLEDAGMTVTRVDLMMDSSNQAYSATRVRQALAMGKIKEANQLLGWAFEIQVTVIKGDQRGRTLGYPTANATLGEGLRPAYGVYAADIMIEGENLWRRAAVNIGIRPMFETPDAVLEAHILDYSGDLYGKNLRIRPLQYLRAEAKFESLDALRAQMATDCENSKAI